MGCLYCGGAIPPKPPGTGGRPRKFCSLRCAKNYSELLRQRRITGSTLAFCKNCGQILKGKQKDYCSEFCRKRSERELHIEGVNALRMAVLRQAKRDHVLKTWSRTEQFYQMFPELTPDQFKKEKRS